ncbi:MAG: LamG domain-containing protein, partial [Phycisphaerae bacterium]|nr:LamG domain-containing protein [Phycisphaerae bacterium]
ASDITVNYALRYETDGSLGFFYRAASDTGWFEYNSDGGVIGPGRWQHVAVTHTFGTADIAVYVDGLPVGGFWSATPTEGPMTTDESLLFGGTALTPGGTTMRLVDGRLDEVRIWNVARNAKDIAASFNAVLDGDEPGLVGYWRFEEGAGGSAADTAGGYTGSLVGPTWFELDECAPPCPSDVDGSGDVGFTDLLAILSNWGPCAGCGEDLDGSGDVGFTDLLAVLSDWGGCPVATGACCLPGACEDLSADDCTARGGVYNAGESCADIGCPGDDGWIVSAPLVWSGDTCTDGFDCDLESARDSRWQITIPADGSWTFSVCGASFDTVMFLGTTPCSEDVAASDDACDIASEIQVDLTAGVYYLTLEGFSSDECGGYTLAVSQK